MSISMENIINVNISTAPTLLSGDNVNVIGIFTKETPLFPINNYVIYKNPNSCMNDWGVDSETFKMVNNIFSQNLNILAGGGYVVVFPLANNVTISATAGSYEINNLIVDKWSAVVDGTFKISVDGEEAKTIELLDFTEVKTLEDIAEVINATFKTADVEAVVEATETGLIIKSNTTGVNSSIAIEANNDGVDLTGLNYLNIEQGKIINGQAEYTGSERLQDAILRTKDLTFYMAILTTFDSSDAEVLASASLIQPMNKMLFVVSNDVNKVADGGLFNTIKNLKYTKTRCLYYNGESDYKLFASGYASKLLSVNFNGSGTANNLAVKEIIGLLPDNTINDNLLLQVKNAGADCYCNLKGLGVIMTSGANEWSDTVLFLNWLKNALEVAGFNALRGTPTKLAQTETGVQVLKNSYINILEQAIRLGYVASGTWNLPFTFGEQELFFNNIEQVGYYIYSEPVALQSQNERDERKAPLIQIAIKLAGAINSSDVICFINN